LRIIIETDLRVPAPDGILLATDVHRPAGAGPWPTLVARMPYNKDLLVLESTGFDVHRAVKAGYAVVLQDSRGRFASDGQFVPFADEAADGAATIAWAAEQPWSTGEVGMIGGSYLGMTQWAAASQAPPALRAIAPVVTPDQQYDGWVYQGGAFQLGFTLWWVLTILSAGELQRRMTQGDPDAAQRLEQLVAASDDENLYLVRPLRGHPALRGIADYYDSWLDHPTYDAYWKATAPREHWAEITVPALNVGGWFDVFLQGTLANYVGMRQAAASDEARFGQRLVIGPWAHGALSGTYPEQSFGMSSGIDGAVDLTGLQLQWFDRLLKGEGTGWGPEFPVRLFVMGVNEWRAEADWPLPDTKYVDWFLHSSGRANTATGDGELSMSDPQEAEADDVFIFDPRHPVPTVGGASYLPGLFIGANSGPRNQEQLEQRPDVLCYTSEALTGPLTVIGPLEAVLYVSSSAVDTDITAKLVDVAPDGRAMSIADGILRCRFRESLQGSTPMSPGQIYELRITMVATAVVFAADHRIRLEVSSSNFPRFDANTNTGGNIADEGDLDLVVAINRVHHDADHASRVVLPVIAR
jgi:uncharacterized protein